MQFFMSFYGGQLKQQLCSSKTLLIFLYGFNPLKMAVQVFETASSVPNFDGPNVFSKIQQAPGPDFIKVGISLFVMLALQRLISLHIHSVCLVFAYSLPAQ